MELSEAIEKRKSSREFKKCALRSKSVLAILEAARLAPFSCNMQTYHSYMSINQNSSENSQVRSLEKSIGLRTCLSAVSTRQSFTRTMQTM
ncbi:MAG: hypothetical protein HC945_03570 [Nitrosarchaeum sp.]|nr:hypothetical protein [Nitrosarchaeum sp.]